MESLDIVLEKYHKTLTWEEKVKYAEEKNTFYKELLRKMSPADLSLEVKETLDQLKGKGLKLAIGSSSKNAGFILERIGLAGYFDAVSDGNNISNSKPDPEVFFKAAHFMKLEPKDCLVVEDSVAGLQAAVNGNMDCAAMGDAVKSELATYQLQNFKDLLTAVEDGLQ